ncbi:MAG: RNA polymerase sigma factor [Acidimicrobiales bacterium]
MSPSEPRIHVVDDPEAGAPTEVRPLVDRLFTLEHPRLVRLASVALGSPAAGEDVVADAFLKAWQHRAKLEQLDDPAGWIRRVVLNTAISRRRKLANEATTALRLRARRHGPEHEPTLPDADLWALVNALSRRQREAVLLMVVGDLTAEELAAVLECGVETLRTHYRRAREALRAKMEEAP